MPLPKAVLCLLENATQESANAEAALRASGFATATITWKEIMAQQTGLAELTGILQDEAIKAWVLFGNAEQFTEELRTQVTLVTLALQRESLPQVALISTGQAPQTPASMPCIRSYSHAEPFGAKLMAGRFKQAPTLDTPFHVVTHIDPFIGMWLELGPKAGKEADQEGAAQWQGFMAGLLVQEGAPTATITAFGVGKRGVLPSKSTLEYPLQGIEGHLNGAPFVACAAKNTITEELAVYLRLEGIPHGVLLGNYPGDDAAEETDAHVFWLV